MESILLKNVLLFVWVCLCSSVCALVLCCGQDKRACVCVTSFCVVAIPEWWWLNTVCTHQFVTGNPPTESPTFFPIKYTLVRSALVFARSCCLSVNEYHKRLWKDIGKKTHQLTFRTFSFKKDIVVTMRWTKNGSSCKSLIYFNVSQVWKWHVFTLIILWEF